MNPYLRTDANKRRILACLDEGYKPTAVARILKLDEAYCLAVAHARREVKRMLARGADPKVVYCNFRDLLTRKECGVGV